MSKQPQRTGTGASTSGNNIATMDITPLHNNVGTIKLMIGNPMMSETFSPTYSAEEVYGRMDPIVTFKNVKRSISFSFMLMNATDTPQAGINAGQSATAVMNKLIQSLYPAYERGQNTSVISAPPFFKLSYINLAGTFSADGVSTGLTGYITNFVSNFGELSARVGVGVGGVPMALAYGVSFTYNVIHDHKVGWYNGNFAGGHHDQFPYKNNPGSGEVTPQTPVESNPEPHTPAARTQASRVSTVMRAARRAGTWPTPEFDPDEIRTPGT
jgi:hypothetical protein